MTEPSRTAAIGSILVARIAGRRLAEHGDQRPDAQADQDRPGSEDERAARQLDSGRREELHQPDGDPEPEEQPGERADDADGDRLEHDRPEHLPAGRAEGAQGRELTHPLGDRDCERVRDHEAPDEQRDSAEPDQDVLDHAHVVLGRLAVRGGLYLRALDLGGLREERIDLPHELRFGGAGLRCDADHVEPTDLVEHTTTGLEIEDRDRRAADRVDGAEADDAGDPVLRHGAVGEDANGLPDLEALLLGGRLVDRDLAVATRPLARHELERVHGLVGGGVEREREPVVDLADRLAGLVDQPCLVFDRPLGVADARQVGDLGQNAG